jgi:protein-S-isoprenylcysteine O-methyltransferase Ste14
VSGSLWSVISAWVIALCWGLFGLVWVAGALYNVRRAPPARQRSMTGYWLIPAALVLWLIGHELPEANRYWGIPGGVWIRVIGVVVLLAATSFTLWARGVLGTMWSASVVIKDDHRLRTDGPYAITRHPIYTGVLGMLLGTVLLTGAGLWAVWLVLFVVLVELKIHSEERLLTRQFPVEYERYRSRVPQLIPGAGLLRHR